LLCNDGQIKYIIHNIISSIYLFIHSFVHYVPFLTTGSQTLSKQVLHILRSTASSFDSQYLVFSLRPSSNCPRLLPCLRVHSIFLPITYSRILVKCLYVENTNVTIIRVFLYLYVNNVHSNCTPVNNKIVKAVCLSVITNTVVVTTVINNDDDSIKTVCNFVGWVYCHKLTISLL